MFFKRSTVPVICSLLLLACPVWATKVKSLSLDKICKSAGKIFEGECTDIKTGKDPESGFLCTWYTFKVADGIKGKPAETETIKVYGGSEGNMTVHSMIANFTKGEKAIVFFYPPSQIGLTSCVGLNQGKFSIQEDPDTKARFVTNGMPAKILFDGLDQIVSPQPVKKMQLAEGFTLYQYI